MHINSAVEESLQAHLRERKENYSLRTLTVHDGKIDFSSNDYLSFSTSGKLLKRTKDKILKYPDRKLGATGSRHLSGESELIQQLECSLAKHHGTESALLFNSGYDANVGLLSCIASKSDSILYDSLCHASIRDGIRLSRAKSYSFRHNDLEDLDKKLKHRSGNTFIIVESLYSMDGDAAPLTELAERADSSCALIVDEAHATGLYGKNGSGLVDHLNVRDSVYATVHTFGKSLGSHGALIASSDTLKKYLINNARSLIYTTGMSRLQLLTVESGYEMLPHAMAERKKLQGLITLFCECALKYQETISQNNSPIQYVMISGNDRVLEAAKFYTEYGFIIPAVRAPTVPAGKERLRICLHAHNTPDEVKLFFELYERFITSMQ